MKASYKSRKLLQACALSLVVAFSMPALTSAKALERAVLLKEQSEMIGAVDFLVGKDGFSMVLHRSKLALFMKAPLWHVVYANLQDKIYYECKADEWKVSPSVFSALCRPSSPTSLRLTTSQKTKYKGLPCLLFEMETKEASRGTDKTWKRLMPKNGKIWLFQQQGFPRQAYQMAANLLALPSGPGIPLSMEFSKFDGKTTKELQLYGFENRLIEGSEFSPPRNFKRVPDQGAVFNKEVESKDLADFLDEK